jgi:hypothetical protein
MTTGRTTIEDMSSHVGVMVRTARRITMLHAAAVGVFAASLVLVGCSTPVTSTPPTTPQPAPPRAEDAAGSAALSAYTEYWRVTDAARAAPAAQDWRPAIEAVARGQALEIALRDVENYASLPAHTVGAITRVPQVIAAEPTRVSILDCVDLGNSRVISDATGATLNDLENRVQRFRLRAEVMAAGDRWLVETAEPALDEPC